MPSSIHSKNRRFFQLIFWLGIAFFHVAADAQNLSPQAQSALDSLLRQAEIRTTYRDFSDSTVLALGRAATFQELLTLSHHPAALVRAAALYGLLWQDELYFTNEDKLKTTRPYLHRLLEEHFMDTAVVVWRVESEHKAHRSYQLRVGEIYLSKIGPYPRPRNSLILSDGYGYRIPKDSMRHFDSLLLFNFPGPWPLYRMARIGQLEPIPDWHAAICRQVEQTGDGVSVCYLAKYQNPEDIDLILSHLPSEKPGFNREIPGHWAPFAYFRHPRLFEYLQQNQPDKHQVNKTAFRYSIAAYQTPAAAILLDSMYEYSKKEDKTRWMEVADLGDVVYRQFVPVYAPLMWKILFENPENSNVRIPDRLWETHADSLAKVYDRWKAGGWGARKRATDMFPLVSGHWAKFDKSQQIKTILDRIKPGDTPRNDQTAWETIWLARDPAYTTPLFDLLEKEPLPENRFFICKIILHQPEAGIRQQLQDFFQLHPALYPDITAAENGGPLISDFYHYAKEKQ